VAHKRTHKISIQYKSQHIRKQQHNAARRPRRTATLNGKRKKKKKNPFFFGLRGVDGADASSDAANE
jgi:hypothetical protein